MSVEPLVGMRLGSSGRSAERGRWWGSQLDPSSIYNWATAYMGDAGALGYSRFVYHRPAGSPLESAFLLDAFEVNPGAAEAWHKVAVWARDNDVYEIMLYLGPTSPALRQMVDEGHEERVYARLDSALRVIMDHPDVFTLCVDTYGIWSDEQNVIHRYLREVVGARGVELYAEPHPRVDAVSNDLPAFASDRWPKLGGDNPNFLTSEPHPAERIVYQFSDWQRMASDLAFIEQRVRWMARHGYTPALEMRHPQFPTRDRVVEWWMSEHSSAPAKALRVSRAASTPAVELNRQTKSRPQP
jgi:hypothetical protein